MSALALAPRVARTSERVGVQDVHAGKTGLGGEPTLDALVSGVWEGLAAHRPVGCPVCGEEMVPAYGAHAKPIGGHCDGCRAALS